MLLHRLFPSKKNAVGADRQELGRLGEDLAVEYLKKQGLRIVERNYRRRLGEVDIIAREGDTVVFVEVKTRRKASHGAPEEAVTLAKMRQLSRVAVEYLARHNLHDQPARFDVVAVDLAAGAGEPAGAAAPNPVPPIIRHYRNAFDLCHDE